MSSKFNGIGTPVIYVKDNSTNELYATHNLPMPNKKGVQEELIEDSILHVTKTNKKIKRVRGYVIKFKIDYTEYMTTENVMLNIAPLLIWDEVGTTYFELKPFNGVRRKYKVTMTNKSFIINKIMEGKNTKGIDGLELEFETDLLHYPSADWIAQENTGIEYGISNRINIS